jgi:hypothetical protein
MSRGRIVIVAAVLAALVLLFVLLRPGDDSPQPVTEAQTTVGTTTANTVTAPVPATPTATRETIVVRDAKPVGGIQRFEAPKGTRVVVVVRSDVADEIHLHGYDLKADAAPGRPARIAFKADLVGRFELELEDHGVQIAELTVEP